MITAAEPLAIFGKKRIHPASGSESIEEACAVHGTNPDELVEKLNGYFAEKAVLA